MFNTKPKIISLDHICPGKRHAWYNTDMGFKVRKPVGQKINGPIFTTKKFNKEEALKDVKNYIDKKENIKKPNIFIRLWNFIKKLWKR